MAGATVAETRLTSRPFYKIKIFSTCLIILKKNSVAIAVSVAKPTRRNAKKTKKIFVADV